MKNFLRFAFVLGLFAVLPFQGNGWADDTSWSGSLRFRVELRPGVVSTIESIYVVNLRHPSGGKTLLAVPGMGLTASSYEPLVEKLFAADSQKTDDVFSAAVLVDFPGHGGSSLPKSEPSAAPLLFGNLTLQDYVNTVLGVLDQLKYLQITPDTLVGHCMGGILIQMAQQQLIARNSDLRTAYGITEVVMIAPDPPGQIQGSRSDPSAFNLAKFTVPNDPVLGTYISLFPQFIMNMWFRNMAGAYVPGAPLEYFKDPSPIANESMMVLLEIFGQPPFAGRPMVNPRIFGSGGTWLTLVAFSQDAFYSPQGQLSTYSYLTGDPSAGAYSGMRFFYVDRPDAVHGMYYSNPAGMLSAGRIFR